MTPTLFLIVGHVGAGKTTLARQMARDAPMLRLSPDEWMMPLFGEPDPGGKRDVLEGRLIWTALEALKLGVSVVLDFGFWGRDERAALHWMAASVGAAAQTIYLPVDPKTQLDRVRKRMAETPDENWDASAEELADWRVWLQEPDEDELAGRFDAVPPAPHADWRSWAAERWPSSSLRE